jgi:hypothetical protein
MLMYVIVLIQKYKKIIWSNFFSFQKHGLTVKQTPPKFVEY